MIHSKRSWYNGVSFRSHVEVAWAEFFTAAGLEYHYECQRFHNLEPGCSESYLPDFYAAVGLTSENPIML